jgi:threonine dehydratase
MDLVTLRDVQAAAVRIEGIAMRTPLLPFGEDFWLKPESLQPIGAFKIRGAANAIAALSPSAVITHSSGNHGRALAYAAARRKIPVTVVMPDTSPKVKVDAIAALGAEIVMVPPPERLDVAQKLASERNATLIPPFDHPEVIAGQGTVGLEILEDLPSQPEADVIIVPVGGGGLISGVAAAVKALRPACRIIGVEPELAAESAESLQRDRLITWPTEKTYQTVADGVRTAPSALTFAHMREYVDDIITVSDEEILKAVGVLATQARLVVEPSGAISVAAYLYRRGFLPGGRTAAVISGGNVDPELLRTCLT